MKKTALLLVNLSLAAALTLAPLANANDLNDQALTLAAADLGVKATWVDTQEDVEARIADELTAKEDALNDKAHAKLEEQLEAKLAKQFEL
jgi:hypothetical protein